MLSSRAMAMMTKLTLILQVNFLLGAYFFCFISLLRFNHAAITTFAITTLTIIILIHIIIILYYSHTSCYSLTLLIFAF